MKMPNRPWLILAVIAAGGVTPAVIVSLFHQDGWARFFFTWLLDSMLYSTIITLMMFGAMHYLGPAYARLPSAALHWTAELLTFGALGVIGSVVGTEILLQIAPAYGGARGFPFGAIFINAVRISVILALVGGVTVSYLLDQSRRLQKATLEIRTRQLDEERARKLAAEARLSSLESKIHPHFLFNSLNSIAALIREDPSAAERMTEKLSGLLRQTLDAGGGALVTLEQELRLVRDYLEIEKTRFGERLRYSVDAPADVVGLAAPPLALQTLVENSVKYAVAARREGAEIRVSARKKSDCLVLEVSDDGPGFEASALKPDHGLENLRERLSALFDGAGSLEIARREGRMVVTVQVPQRKAPA